MLLHYATCFIIIIIIIIIIIRVLVVAVNFFFRLFPFVSFPQISQYFMTWGSPRASLYVKCVGYSEGCVPPACVDSQEV